MKSNWYGRPYGNEDGVRYTYYEDLKETYTKLGYSSAKEAIIDLYEKLGGCIPVAKKLGISKSTIQLKLKAFRHPMKGRGGSNNPFGRYGNPDKRKEFL
jgi:hypothetical protein